MSREAIEKAIRGGALNAVKELDRNGWIGNEDHTARVCAVLEPVFAVFRDAVLEEAAKAVSRLSPQTNEQADMQEWAVAQIRHMKSKEPAKP